MAQHTLGFAAIGKPTVAERIEAIEADAACKAWAIKTPEQIYADIQRASGHRQLMDGVYWKGKAIPCDGYHYRNCRFDDCTFEGFGSFEACVFNGPA